MTTASAESSRIENLGVRIRRTPAKEQSKDGEPPPLQSAPPPSPPLQSLPPLLPPLQDDESAPLLLLSHDELEPELSLLLPLQPPDVDGSEELPLHDDESVAGSL